MFFAYRAVTFYGSLFHGILLNIKTKFLVTAPVL